LDLGCGIGYTTAAIKQMLPNARVIGTNIKDTLQMRFAEMMSSNYAFEMHSDLKEIKSIDLIFASEYFEHFQEPITHLEEVLRLNPRFLLIANTFSAKAVGHFLEYSCNRTIKTGNETSRLFNQTLRNNGYEKVTTKLWNSRPTYWRRIAK